MLKTSVENYSFKHRPNQLYMLGYGDAAVQHGRIIMGPSALNGQRKRYGFIDDKTNVSSVTSRQKTKYTFS